MRLVVFATIVLNTYSLAQSCVFDGKAMKSLGVSEVVNKETLSLFRCSEGHQMWLTDEELDTCLLYTSPSPRDLSTSRMPSSA